MDQTAFFERYSVSSWLFIGQPLEVALPKIASVGFRSLELWGDSAHLDPRVRPDIAGVERLLGELGLRAQSIHAPYSDLRLGYPDKDLLPMWRTALKATLEHAAALNAEAVVLHLLSHDEKLTVAREQEGVQRALELISWASERAARLGLRLLVENRLPHGDGVFGSSFAELVPLLTDERVGFCLDTGHAAVGGHDIEREVALAGPRLCSVHANNNDGRSDLHATLTEGVLKWDEVEAAFMRHGYTGPMVLEVAGGLDPDAVLSRLATLWQDI